MTKLALVSVIIPFLNAEQFIREAIESVLAQSYEEWELLLVDDGSVDGSTKIAQDYSKQYSDKVRYLAHAGHQNQGPAGARNLGILHSHGDYLTFLDADDVWVPDKLQQQVALLDACPQAGMLYGLSRWWYSWTGNPADCERDFVYELGLPADTLQEPPALLVPFFVTQKATLPNPTNFMVRRRVIEEIGGFEDDFRGRFAVYEDQAFIAKVCLAFPILATNICWDNYRQHTDSITSVAEKRGQDIEARVFFLNWLANYVQGKGLAKTDAWRAIRAEIRMYRYPGLAFFRQSRHSPMKRVKDLLWRVARQSIPAALRSWLWARWHHQAYIPPSSGVRFGNLRRITPFSREFGYDRGQPIDRYYIEQFLGEHRKDVRGHVLEIADNTYTCRFGSDVDKGDVLHLQPGNPQATLVADLTHADHIPTNTYDCIILTQTLQFIFDVPAALQTIHRILKPGGVVLATFPGISPISRYDMERWGHFWGFTSLSARRLFEEVFLEGQIEVRTYGNVLTASAFLFGMASEELNQQEIEYPDPDYEVIIAIRAAKSEPTVKLDNS
jgi:glycosyltransferase involved in cell wall biosynthesis